MSPSYDLLLFFPISETDEVCPQPTFTWHTDLLGKLQHYFNPLRDSDDLDFAQVVWPGSVESGLQYSCLPPRYFTWVSLKELRDRRGSQIRIKRADSTIHTVMGQLSQ